MRKIIVSMNENKKIEFIKKIEGNKVLVCFKGDFDALKDLGFSSYILVEELNNSIKYLDFLSKISGETNLIVYDTLRFKTHNNTVYNKIYKLCDSAINILVTTNLPFIFTPKNIFIPLKMIGVMKYHYKQFYDDSFYVDGMQANSLEYILQLHKDDIIVCEKNTINFETHNWESTEDEMVSYANKKQSVIYEKEYPKIKVMTSLAGFVNRMQSKFDKLHSILKPENKYVVIMNWDFGIQQIREKIISKLIGEDICWSSKILPTSYHIDQIKNTQSITDVIFFESIISQKIKFYDLLKYYIDKKIHLFVNRQIGVDVMILNETVDIVNDLNKFYSLNWNNE